MIYENPRPVYPNELYHHGIKNQTWGVTNGPPYPLDRATHNKVVKQQKREARETNRTIKKADKDIERAAFALSAARSDVQRANEKAAKALFGNKFNGAKFDKEMQKLNTAKSREKFWNDKLTKMATEQGKLSDSARKANPYVKRALYDYNNKVVIEPGPGGYYSRKVNVADAARENYADRFNYLGLIGGTVKAIRDNSYIKNTEKAYGIGKYSKGSDKQAGLDKAKAAYKEQKSSNARHTGNAKTTTKVDSSGTNSRSSASEKNAIMKEMNRRFGNSERNKAALEELKTMLKTTKGEYDKNTGTTTYVTQYGIFDVYPGPNGTMRVAFND